MSAGGRKPHRQHLFIWQAALILLPVLVLVLVGLSFLRQDRLLARREAEQRAQEIADELLPRCVSALVATNDLALPAPHILVVSQEGLLVSPPSIPIAAPMLLDFDQLNQLQSSWWRQMQGVDQNPHGLDEQLEAARNLGASNLPDSFMPIALFWLGSLEQKRGNAADAVRDFERLIGQFPGARGETGLPLSPLAWLRLLEIATSSTNQVALEQLPTAADLCSNVVSNPSELTAPILEAVAQVKTTARDKEVMEQWQTRWSRDQTDRQLYAALRPQLHPGEKSIAVYLEMENLPPADGYRWSTSYRWFAFRPDLPSLAKPSDKRAPGGKLVFAPPVSAAEPEILNSIRRGNPELQRDQEGYQLPDQSNSCLYVYNYTELLKRQMAYVRPLNVPPYLGVALQVAGQDLVSPFPPNRYLWREVGYSGKGGGIKKEALPELATEVLASAVADFLRVNVYLTNPSDLFKRQRTRMFWLSSVIGTSFLAAIVGLFAAWRSFSRQEQLAEMKTNFVSSVSHELRAPIASVRLLAESLERGNVSTPDKQTQYYHFIGQECRRLSSLIENVLDFSRIEQGRKQYEFEPTDLLALVRQTVALMYPYGQGREVSLVCDVDESIHERLEVSIDGQAIQQALINLIDNALKHSAKGQVVKVGLTVGTKAGETNGEERTTAVQIYVEDQGPGIPEGEHERIFERFYRLGSELRRETQGIGIGLSIVKHIVEAHAGRVILRSSLGAGSRFTVELPQHYGTSIDR